MNDDTNLEDQADWTAPPGADPSSPAQADWAAPRVGDPAAPSSPPGRGSILRTRVAAAAAVAGLATGGAIGGVLISQAATATPSPSSGSSTTPGSGSSGAPGMPGGCAGGMHGVQSEDLSVVAGAIGISASDLQTALGNGQTIAAAAKAHNVDVNKVISAWVASENKEIDAQVSSGRLSQAQGAQLKTQTQQRVTDEVNGVHPAGGPGRFGHDGPGGPFGAPGAAPGSSSGSGTTQSSTGTSA